MQENPPKDLSLDEAISSLNQKKVLDSKSAVIGKPIAASHIGDYGLTPIKGADRASILRTPGDTGSRYDEGFVQDVSLDDYRYNNQGGGMQLAGGLSRLAGSTILKASQGVSTLGSALGAGAADLAIGAKNLMSDDKNQSEYFGLDEIVNNPINNIFYGMEDWWKEVNPIYKPQGWDDKSFLQQLGSTAWWADEGADAAAYALSTFVPAGAIGKLGLGAKVAGLLGGGLELAEDGSALVNSSKGLFGAANRVASKVGKAGKLGEIANELLLVKSGLTSPAKFAQNLDLLTQNAFMTSSEALAEAKQTGETITSNYLQARGKQDISELNADELAQLKENKATSMQATFFANVAALAFSNHIEAGLVNKAFGISGGKSLKGLVNPGESIFDAASRVERKGIQRFLMDSKLGTLARNIPKYAITEGLYEENIQSAIQDVSSKFGHEGKLDYIQDVLKTTLSNLDDKEAWKSIGAGMVIGSLFGGVGSIREKSAQDKAISSAVNNINTSSENFINLKNSLYLKDEEGKVRVDEEGKPIYDTKAITDFAANSDMIQDLSELHDGFKDLGKIHTARILKDELFTKYAVAHLEAGLEEELKAKVKALSSYKDEDLAQLGFDPIEIENGIKVSPSHRANNLLERVEQISNDYNQIIKTIPQTDENSPRINEATKAITRFRNLDGILKSMEEEAQAIEMLDFVDSFAEGEKDYTVEEKKARAYNKQKAKVDSWLEALKVAIPTGTINEEIVKKDLDNINKSYEELKSFKDKLYESEEGKNYKEDEDGLLINGEHNPDYLRSYAVARKISQARVAKKQQIGYYNKLVDYKNGENYFVNRVVDKRAFQIEKENIQEDEENTTASELEQFEAGDFVEYGEGQTGYVTPLENGSLTVNGQVLSKVFLDSNPNIRKYSEQELASFKSNNLSEFRKGQLQNRINQTQSRIDALLTRDSEKQEAILNKLIEIDELITNKDKGLSRTSERKLARHIANIEDAINQISQEREVLLDQADILQSKIEDIQDDQINGSIEDNYEQLDTWNIDLQAVNTAIAENNSWIGKLTEALKTFQNLWKRFFPNKVLNLEKGRKEYTDAKQEIQLTKDEIKDLESANVDLLEVKTRIESRIQFLEKEIQDYELQAASLEYNAQPILPEEQETKENPVTTNSEFTYPMPDIVTDLFKTAGNHRQGKEQDSPMTESYSQKVWYKFVEEFDSKNTEKVALRTITINDPVYGLSFPTSGTWTINEAPQIPFDVIEETHRGNLLPSEVTQTKLLESRGQNQDGQYVGTVQVHWKDKDGNFGITKLEVKFKKSFTKERDLFSEDAKEYQTENNIKVLAVDKDGNPINKEGSLVYTSLPEANDTRTQASDYPAFRSSNEELAKQAIKDYQAFAKLIKQSKEPLFLQIVSKSNGVIVKGEPISADKAFGEKPKIKVITDKQTTIGGNDYSIPVGLVYADYKGRPVGANTRTLNPEESLAVLNKLKEYAKLRGDKEAINNGNILNQIKSTIFLGSRKANPELSIFFVKGEDKLIFGNNSISTAELIDGKYDNQLRSFLDNQNLQVDKVTLDKDGAFTDIFGKQWKSYSDYLLTEREAIEETPLLFPIAPKSDDINKPQFYNTYLTYSNPKNSVEDVQPQETTTSAQADAFDFGTSLDFISLSSMADVPTTTVREQLEPTEEVINEIKESIIKSRSEGIKSLISAYTGGKQYFNIEASGTEIADNLRYNNVTAEEIRYELKENLGGKLKSWFERGLEVLEKEEIKENVQTDLLDEFFLDTTAVENFKPIDLVKEEQWFKDNISTTIPFNIVKGLIDKRAYGKFVSNGQVLISDIAAEGTTYHEAFHVVSQLYLTPKEREGLYNQWKNNNKGEYTDRQVEEALAEEFREHVLTKDSLYKTIFNKIINFIKSLVGIGNSDRDLLFSRIASGKFKDANLKSTSDLNLYKMSDKFDATTVKDLMDSMTLTLVRGLFKNNFSIADSQRFNEEGKITDKDQKWKIMSKEDYDRIKNLYSSVLASIITRLEQNTSENSDFIKEDLIPYIQNNQDSLKKDHQTYLSKYGINLEVEPEDSFPEETERAKDTLGIISSIEFSSKSGMPNMVKLMIASLPKYGFDASGNKITILNNLGLPMLSDYRRNTAILQNELAGISSFKEQMYKIKQLSLTTPELALLADQLGVSQSVSTPENLRADYFNLQAQFRQQFDKAYYDFSIQLYDENNNFLTTSSNDLKTTIKARWQGQAFANKKAYKNVGGVKILNATYFKEKYDKPLKGLEKIKSVLSFYKDLGITFSKPQLVDIDILADRQKALIAKMEQNNISSVFQDEAESKGFVNAVLEQEVKSTLDYSDNQHINPEGKTVYNVSLHNYLTRLTYEINNFGFPEELQWDEETKTGNPLLRHSIWSDKINNGQQIKVGILEGAKVNEAGETGVSTSKLTYPDAASQQFTAVLNGQFPFLRAGDKALEHSFTFGDSPSYMDLQQATNTFKGYLADELLSSYMLNVEGIGAEYPEYAKSANDLRVFKDIFSDSIIKDYKAIISNSKINREEAIRRIDEFSDRDDVKASLQTWLDNHTEENLQVLEDNNLISKTQTFDVTHFENGQSPIETPNSRRDEYTLVGISSELADKFIGKSSKLTKGQMISLVEQFTYNQLISGIEQTKLFTGDVAFYKDFFKRTSGLTGTGKGAWVGQEVDSWLNENRPRPDKQSDGKIKTLVFKDVESTSSNYENYVKTLVDSGLNQKYAEDLLKAYKKAYEEGDAQGYITLPEYREFLSRTGDWTASHEVMYPKLLAGDKISKADLGNFLSGFPVLKPQYFGKQTDNNLFIPTFYKFSVMPLIPSVIKGTNLESLNRTMMDGYGISLFKSGNKVGAKEGNDFYTSDGLVVLDSDNLIQQEIEYQHLKIQLDMSPKVKEKVIFGTQFRKLILANLAGKFLTIKGKQISGERLINEYSRLIDKTVEKETEKLIKKLGLKQKDENNFVLENPDYLRDLLSSEAFRRQAPDNLLEGIKQVLPERGDVKQFDVLVNRNKIENILMSLVDNAIIKQKTFGDLRVQGASTGFQSGARVKSIADVQDSAWFSQIEGEKSLSFYKVGEPMEILLPHYFKELIGEDVDLNQIDPKLLNIVGYRTPTQGLNSMEFMKIKGFLPQEAGNLVILPSEIVVKSGSDFDIDKLSLHFPSYEIVDGKPKYIEYKGNEENLSAIHNRLNDLAWKIGMAPENFQQLITPNSTGEVEAIAKEIQLLKPKTKSKTNNGRGAVIGWKMNLDTRAAFMEGKEGIGIAATHNTNHVLNQIVKLKSKPNVPIYLAHNTVSGAVKLSTKEKVIEIIKQGLVVRENSKDRDFSARFDLGMPTKDQQKAVEDIKKGKLDTAPAKKLIELVTKFENENSYPIIEGTGGNTSRNRNATSEEISSSLILPSTNVVDFSQQRELNADPINSPTILENISAFLNGLVDAAKNPFLVGINGNIETLNTYMYLIKAGVPLRQAIMFMNQPIITDFLTDSAKNNSLALKVTGNKLSEDKLIEKVYDKYPIKYKDLDLSDPQILENYKKSITTAKLEEAIQGNINNVTQRRILLDYLMYKDQADSMSDLIKATSADTRGTGATMNSAQEQVDKFTRLRQNSIFENVDSYLEQTFIGSFQKAVEKSTKFYKSLFYTEEQAVKNELARIKQLLQLNKYADVEKGLNLAKNDLINYVLQTSPLNNLKLMNVAKDLFSGENSIAKVVARYKEDGFIKDNLLIRELFPLVSNNDTDTVGSTSDLDNLKFFSKRMEAADSNLVTEGWKELFNLGGNYAKLAQNLLIFTIQQSGLNNSPVSFTEFIPNEQYVPIAARLLANKEVDFTGFYEKFISNNWRNDDLVPRIKKSVQTVNGPVELANEKTARVQQPRRSKYTGRLIGRDMTQYSHIKAGDNLYRNTGEVQGRDVIFERVTKRGDGSNFKEWADESIVLSNRIPSSTNAYSALNKIGQDKYSSGKEIRKAYVEDMINQSALSEEDKQKYSKLLAEAKTQEDIGKILKEICS